MSTKKPVAASPRKSKKATAASPTKKSSAKIASARVRKTPTDPVKSLVSKSKIDKNYQDHKKANTTIKPVPYVLADNYVQGTVDGVPFSLNRSHPTFEKMVKALKAKDWKAIPKLVSAAKQIPFETFGDIGIKDGVVMYKGQEVHSTLTERIIELHRAGKNVKNMALFMDNLYQNPEPAALREFYDWLENNKLPITDDGYFLAYKSVDQNYMDQHTNTVNNRPGQLVRQDRRSSDEDWRTQCGEGLHICSKQYGMYGSKVMCVKVNPRDVLSAEGGKMRVIEYEVLRELGSKNEALFKEEGYKELEGQLVVAIKAERQELIKILLRDKNIKKAIKLGKTKEETVKSLSYARLTAMANRYDAIPDQYKEKQSEQAPPQTLVEARKAHKLFAGQIAKAMHISPAQLAKLEKDTNPAPNLRNDYLGAIAELCGVGRRPVTWPLPSENAQLGSGK